MTVVNAILVLLRRAARHFTTARSGSVAIIFALVLIPLLGFVGVAIDYSRASSVKARCRRRSIPPR